MKYIEKHFQAMCSLCVGIHSSLRILGISVTFLEILIGIQVRLERIFNCKGNPFHSQKVIQIDLPVIIHTALADHLYQ